MNLRIPIFLASCIAALTLAVPHAQAQIDPNDPLGLGTKLGVQTMNNSGQLGSVNLHKRGVKTFVDVSIEGVPHGKVETASIHRMKDCDGAIDPKATYVLSDVRNGRSRTLLAVVKDRLLSGNYGVVIASKENPHHYFGCGHLYK